MSFDQAKELNAMRHEITKLRQQRDDLMALKLMLLDSNEQWRQESSTIKQQRDELAKALIAVTDEIRSADFLSMMCQEQVSAALAKGEGK